jgi:hypothetical protein
MSGVTPPPVLASRSRNDSPSVMIRWAWCMSLKRAGSLNPGRGGRGTRAWVPVLWVGVGRVRGNLLFMN